MFVISFQKTEDCIKEIEEILNDISNKLQDNLVLDKHEELNRILFSRVIVQFTQEFNDNAEIVWNKALEKHKSLQEQYDDTKKLLLHQYIGKHFVLINRADFPLIFETATQFLK